MSQGVLLFAQNNHTIDYIKQAIFCAKKIKKHLGLSVTIATDTPDYLYKTYPYYSKYIDDVVDLEWEECSQKRVYQDGTMSNRNLEWRNHNRTTVYDITPYDETIVMDTDFIIGNKHLLNIFDTDEDFLIVRDITDVNPERNTIFDKISDRSIDMYWATLFYFKKTERTKLFFDLVTHIKENWLYYRLVYQIPNTMYRNDFSFSIAIHLMNGNQKTNWPKQPPGNLWFTTDMDVLIKMDDEKYVFLLDKKDWKGHYIAASINDANIHIMNKFSLDRAISEVLADE
jgi:hypothetical protein